MAVWLEFEFTSIGAAGASMVTNAASVFIWFRDQLSRRFVCTPRRRSQPLIRFFALPCNLMPRRGSYGQSRL
jgi:hypothetical protein